MWLVFLLLLLICTVRYIARDWNFVSKPTVFYHDDDYFLVKLNSMEDRDQVLFSGPHSLFW